MAELSKDIIGRKLDEFTYTVERGKVQEFCMAIGEDNPIYRDLDAARAAGFTDVPIPPTYQTTFVFWGYGYEKFWKDLGEFGIDTTRLLHMKEEYTYLKPVYPGTEIVGNAEVIDVKIGKMNMVTLKSIYSDAKSGETYIEAIMAIVIRPEGK